MEPWIYGKLAAAVLEEIAAVFLRNAWRFENKCVFLQTDND